MVVPGVEVLVAEAAAVLAEAAEAAEVAVAVAEVFNF